MVLKVFKDVFCQEVIEEGEDVDFGWLLVQICWLGDVGLLIIWGLIVICGLNKEWQNLGIYCQQVIGCNKVIMCWFSYCGGVLDYCEWCQKYLGQFYLVVVVLGVDLVIIFGVVMLVLDIFFEYVFVGLLCGYCIELVKCCGSDLQVLVSVEIVFEGVIYFGEMVDEGFYGDYIGYYNEVDCFLVFIVECVICWQKLIYYSIYIGCLLDELVIFGVVLNEVFVLILQKQFLEIVDFYLLLEGCFYWMVVVIMKKQYLGYVKCVMFGVWLFLWQFMYIKFVIVIDDDIDVCDWNDVIWVIIMWMDFKCDMVMIDNMFIDYFDFVLLVFGFGLKMGFDVIYKWLGEISCEWGCVIVKDEVVIWCIDVFWLSFGID